MTEHIKIPDIAPVIRMRANGVQTVFEFPFPIFASEDLHVDIDGAVRNGGYEIVGAGGNNGGRVTFDTAPRDGSIVVLSRRMAFERLTDFIEGGDLSAAAMNTELDTIVAGLQQMNSDMASMLRYPVMENPARSVLPERRLRAGKMLGFDGLGDPIAVAVDGGGAVNNADYTASGIGAITRMTADKLAEKISVRDFGAVGDGLSDDTLAFQAALGAHDDVFVPAGDYIVNATIALNTGQRLSGVGDASIIRTASDIVLIDITGSYARLDSMKLFGGRVGLRLKGGGGPCVNNAVTDVSIWQAKTGIVLDGGNDTNRPCYWNNFSRVLVAQPFIDGIHLRRDAGGDSPNANRFHQARVYSLGAETSGHGLFIEAGSFNNAFVDFEANVNATAQACIRCGAGSNKTLFVNVYTESHNGVPNIRLDTGSTETAIYNLLSASDGAAIYDLSGGQYTAFNAGFPYKNRLQKTAVTDLSTTLQRYDTRYTDASGGIDIDPTRSVHLLSSFGGALTARLPKASDAVGVAMTIKKIDASKNVVTIAETNGSGPDRKNYFLGSPGDYVSVLSNGAEWFVTASNRSPGNTRYFDGSGVYPIDMAVDCYLLSAFSGPLTARLPPANAPESIGRTITIKKTDVSTKAISITELGGSGPDGFTQVLSAQYQAIGLVSDGGRWHILSRFP